MKRKICVVITARPSYSRIRSALYAIKEHPNLELQLIISGSALLAKYGSAIDFIVDDGFIPDAQIYHMVEGETLLSSAKSTGLALIELSTELSKLQPDAVITIADRYETLATAIAASYSNIPVVHVQGGEITGSIDEKVRHAVTKLSDIHFVSTQESKRRVISMGENPDCVFWTGCPSIDLAKEISTNPTIDFDPFEKYGGVGDSFDIKHPYLVVMQHPITTEYTDSSTQIRSTLSAIMKLGIPAFWFWPNPDSGSEGVAKEIRVFREHNQTTGINFVRNMSPEDFLKIAIGSKCIVGNSSVAIRECSYLGIPAVNIGTRQQNRERGMNVIDSTHNERDIYKSVKSQMNMRSVEKDILYGNGDAGKKMADILSICNLDIRKTLLL
ncbi:MAG: UDP-N-acetylglucosamine 2-epimerase (hydrolyzing) [Chloroflexi bacterium]|nr:UDP-N-acetylglucosamine 2-epimerase (hydrolyzing) [Chloroflexota bacterium]|tara:strand:- start:12713 stop:13867 length:1155 start_codon:yes stop_codon:yes gene_type:complete